MNQRLARPLPSGRSLETRSNSGSREMAVTVSEADSRRNRIRLIGLLTYFFNFVWDHGLRNPILITGSQ